MVPPESHTQKKLIAEIQWSSLSRILPPSHTGLKAVPISQPAYVFSADFFSGRLLVPSASFQHVFREESKSVTAQHRIPSRFQFYCRSCLSLYLSTGLPPAFLARFCASFTELRPTRFRRTCQSNIGWQLGK